MKPEMKLQKWHFGNIIHINKEIFISIHAFCTAGSFIPHIL
ncbi:hypothetical protein RintRC_1021 [Richelia intracellularis]|nr:hypothetical protein RintRC_1021 [Richelia intracellularis]